MRWSRFKSVKCALFSSFVRCAPIPLTHHHHQGAIGHIQPVATSNKPAGSISCKRAIGVSAKIWFVKAGHDRADQAVRREGVSRTPANIIPEVTLVEKCSGLATSTCAWRWRVCPSFECILGLFAGVDFPKTGECYIQPAAHARCRHGRRSGARHGRGCVDAGATKLEEPGPRGPHPDVFPFSPSTLAEPLTSPWSSSSLLLGLPGQRKRSGSDRTRWSPPTTSYCSAALCTAAHCTGRSFGSAA